MAKNLLIAVWFLCYFFFLNYVIFARDLRPFIWYEDLYDRGSQMTSRMIMILCKRSRFYIKEKNMTRSYQAQDCGISSALTHLPLEPHICVNELGPHWFRYWFVTYLAPSHYLNQCWLIVNWTLGNKLQWRIQENAIENVVCQNGGHFVQGEMSWQWRPDSLVLKP